MIFFQCTFYVFTRMNFRISHLVCLHFMYGFGFQYLLFFKYAIVVDHIKKTHVVVQSGTETSTQHGSVSAIRIHGREVRAFHS